MVSWPWLTYQGSHRIESWLSLSQLLSVPSNTSTRDGPSNTKTRRETPMSRNQTLKVQKKKAIFIFLYDTVWSLGSPNNFPSFKNIQNKKSFISESQQFSNLYSVFLPFQNKKQWDERAVSARRGMFALLSLGVSKLQFKFTAQGSRRGSKERVASSTNSVFLNTQSLSSYLKYLS